MQRKNGHPLIVPEREPVDDTEERPCCTARGDTCESCPYPRHGFICWFGDGTCIRTEIAKQTGRRF